MNKKAIITSSLLSFAVLSTTALAEKARFTASVKVQNTFELLKDKDLLFGTIRAKADTSSGDVATLIMPADPDVAPTAKSNGNAVITIMSGESNPAAFSIKGLPAYAVLTLTDPTETDLVLPGTSSTAAKFSLNSFTYYVTKGAKTGDVSASTIQADDKGDVEFNLGATLSTSSNTADGTTADYSDGDYSGTFSVQVNY
ncbi:DUF4402 domain-containing protein [Pseudoalteromonas sp. JBTF-M23]|uniref:DUF4402 domain-containing protein n=1 Tax=Pseudoalteromonas caenipelagi TaxID=2726988 RepID=A0A849VBT3_9GAMM|nr:DUF4402 domain-containing protein [Pseudoalteromonas caenipelagi]NOU50746.1 DUF4402 domain-containing protein [Pseudoalteromonas caenipelagi]